MIPWKDRTALQRSIRRRQMREAELERQRKAKERREREAVKTEEQKRGADRELR